ncbi:hypothetical protein B0T10DRAFT_439315 [Thelonectria olida]|uniref:Uncharacterized protein n=1 Tax=Thelonectria olida TaxID=1576542 RepID=A0A9P9AQQ7_9HYPO|nr:hypothetical protein B0T10DRAFT_439315 [Thelonectria olida]
MPPKSDIFVNYEGPRLSRDQKLVVRSRAMVSFRAKKKDGANQKRTAAAETTLESTETQAAAAGDVSESLSSVQRRAPKLVPILPRPRDIGPTGCHPTGIHARVFQNYLSLCGAYSSYLDEAYILVGFHQPNFFRPDMSKSACIYIGWLLTKGILDAFRGTSDFSYPYYEWNAVRELQAFLDTATNAELYQVVYPVAILGMFEMVRFSPYTVTHLAAVERFIKTRGGLQKMPPPMQAIVVMADLLQCICLDTKLAFSYVGRPLFHCQAVEKLGGDHMVSSPLLRCEGEEFSLVGRFIRPEISARLAQILGQTFDAVKEFCGQEAGNEPSTTVVGIVNLDDVADGVLPAHDLSGLVVQTCAIASRIAHRTMQKRAGFHDSSNWTDMCLLYNNIRFINLKSWAGLPYLRLWVNLIGLASSTKLERSYFVAELMRATFSWGCYQMEVYITFLKNFIHLRRKASSGDTTDMGLNEEV